MEDLNARKHDLLTADPSIKSHVFPVAFLPFISAICNSTLLRGPQQLAAHFPKTSEQSTVIMQLGHGLCLPRKTKYSRRRRGPRSGELLRTPAGGVPDRESRWPEATEWSGRPRRKRTKKVFDCNHTCGSLGRFTASEWESLPARGMTSAAD